MAENCSGNCSTCSESCSSRKIELLKQNDASNIKKVIAVVSGKGGVGKSTVTGLLSARKSALGEKVAIIDADITGPSVPKMFGVKDKILSDNKYIYPSVSKGNIKMISTNLILDDETDPIIWRGSLISNMVSQFYSDVAWGDIDYMFIDMPPGTGDVPLTVFQKIKVDGIVIVTSPQDLVSMIVEKAVKMARMMNIEILGLVENYSYFVCDECDKKHYIYGQSNIEEVAEKYGVKVLAKLPIMSNVANKIDKGEIESLDLSFVDEITNNF